MLCTIYAIAGLILLISFILFPDEVILNYLGHSSKSINIFLSLLFGSIIIRPGFVAFSLFGFLLSKRVSYLVFQHSL